MRSLFSWLLMFGVIAGLCGRVLALDHLHAHKVSAECTGHSHDACPDGHDHGHDRTDDHSHGDDCPPGPHDHHTHACCHPAPLAGGEFHLQHRLMPPGSSWLGVTWMTTLPPDEPVFALDKPPLI